MEEFVRKTDRQLKQDVMDELAWEPDINAVEIGVAVKDGVVALSGYVDSYHEKMAAGGLPKEFLELRQYSHMIQKSHTRRVGVLKLNDM